MTRAGLVVALGLSLSAAPVFAQRDVTGDWDVTINSPQGANSVKVTLKQDGDKLSGIFKSQMGELPFTGGTLTGDDLKFAFSVPIQGQTLEITLTGKVVDATTITGKAEFGGFGEGDWTAKRAADTGAAAPAPAAAAAPAPAAAAGKSGASGQWDLIFKTPQGDFPAGAMVTETAGKISGTISSQLGEVPFSGTLEGKTLNVSFTMTTPQGSLPVTLTGDIDGDTVVNGKAEITGMGTMEWSAKRKQ